MNREAVYRQLKIDEGVVYEIYKDHLGYPTFGVGHLITKDDDEYREPFGAPISEERVRECFEKDLDTSISECEVLYGEREFGDLPDEVQQVLVNMMLTWVVQDCQGSKNSMLPSKTMIGPPLLLKEGIAAGTSKSATEQRD